MGELIKNDVVLYRKFFKEQARLLGIRVQYRYPIDLDYNLHNQFNGRGYSDPIDVDVIFDQSPKLKSLRRLGFISEDPSDKPYIIQIAYDTPNLQKECLIVLPSPIPGSSGRVFKITELTMDQIMPDSYYCKLAPVFEDKDTLKPSDYDTKSYNFLKVDQDAI